MKKNIYERENAKPRRELALSRSFSLASSSFSFSQNTPRKIAGRDAKTKKIIFCPITAARRKMAGREANKKLSFCYQKIADTSKKNSPSTIHNRGRFISRYFSIRRFSEIKYIEWKERKRKIALKYGRKYGTLTVARAQELQTSQEREACALSLKFALQHFKKKMQSEGKNQIWRMG